MNRSSEDKSQDDHDSSSDTAGDNRDDARPANLLKRRKRISRACDECRRKKIRCDGKQPCTHCTVYSYECTYDQPSNRRRNHAPQYVENLEHRVHRAETLLHILIPDLDLNNPGIDAAVAQGWIPGAPGKGTPAIATQTQTQSQPQPQPQPQTTTATTTAGADMNLPSMIRAVAQIDIDENGNLDYHGHSSGLSFMHRMREHLGDLLGPIPQSTPFVKSRPRSQVHDSPRSAVNSPPMSDASNDDLPPKELARQFCSNAFEVAAALLRVVHGPTFWLSFDRLYACPQEQWTNEEHKFLPLLFSAMAVGCLYGREASPASTQHLYETAIEQGFTYFRAARGLMDIADCRDMQSLQAVTLMIFFMQSTAKLSQCYAYIGVALRSAVRMGLHRSYAAKDHIVLETRKRVFWVIRSLDILVGAMLGLPRTLSDDDIDQELPAEVDDEYITADAILPMPQGAVSLMTAFNAHIRLVNILQKIVRNIYPIKVQSQGDKSYAVPYSAIREIEADLEKWKAELHEALAPSETPGRFTRIQQLLRILYANNQVLLYRPFLHFINAEKRNKSVDQRAYACAATYINVCRSIVHITTQMRNKGFLNGAFWFIMYTSFFSVLSLVYFAAENPDNATTEAVLRDALEGKEVLASLASISMAADRCTVTLDGIFARLPSWMREGKPNPTTSKKRQHNRTPSVQTPLKQTLSKPEVGKSAGHGNQATPDRGQTQYQPYQSEPTMFADISPEGTSPTVFANGSMQPSYNTTMLPDVSALMFPVGNEPFHYPNQPLTTFESNHLQQNNRSSALSTPQHATFAQAQLASSTPHLPRTDDDLETQLLSLPPYLQPSQMPGSQEGLLGMNSIGDYAGLLQAQQAQQIPALDQMSLMNGASNWQANSGQAQHAIQQQQSLAPDLGGMYIQELFGGTEWNPVM